MPGMLGDAMQRGEIPGDFDLVGGIVRDICWNNAREYFGVPLKDGRVSSRNKACVPDCSGVQ